MVERHVRDVEAVGSNPVTSTIMKTTPLWGCFSLLQELKPVYAKKQLYGCHFDYIEDRRGLYRFITFPYISFNFLLQNRCFCAIIYLNITIGV